MNKVENIDDLSPEDQRYYLHRMAEEKKVRDRIEERSAALLPAILEQTGNDWIEFDTADGRTIRAPRAPLVCWALTFNGRHVAPKWKPVSPIGFKMHMDDPYHTDWMIGAGINIMAWYGHSRGGIEKDNALVRAALEMQWKLQCELLRFKVAVLSGSGKARGRVLHPKPNEGLDPKRRDDARIIVIPHAGPEYYQAAMEAHALGGAVISENGGSLSHLANVGREINLKIVRIENAREMYPEPWTEVEVDCDKGDVKIILP